VERGRRSCGNPSAGWQPGKVAVVPFDFGEADGLRCGVAVRMLQATARRFTELKLHAAAYGGGVFARENRRLGVPGLDVDAR